tara:strand:+ start:1219 stop:1410 length:192 start_codon:yes stop_codon:yes gene_type:complete
MKIKAKLDKFNRLQAQTIPCSINERKALKKGEIVDVKDTVAKGLLSLGIVEKTTTKKTNKGEK